MQTDATCKRKDIAAFKKIIAADFQVFRRWGRR